MNPPQPLSVISAIVTPALLILACSSLITATSNRMNRLLDRVRDLTRTVETLGEGDAAASKIKRDFLVAQLVKASKRSKLMQRSMVCLYLSLGALILTSVSIGISSAAGAVSAEFVTVAILISVAFLFYASVLLIRESRIALLAVDAEMDYVKRLTG